MNRLTPLAMALALAAYGTSAGAASSNFSNFTAASASVAGGSLPETAPFALANSAWSQRVIANRTTQTGIGQFNSGSWDMIDSNRTGADRGRYLFSVFETAQAGIQRTDRWTGTTVTLWNSPAAAPALNSAVAFDASRWTPFGTYLTAEESWGAQPQPYGRLFELTNPTTAGVGLPGAVTITDPNGVVSVDGRATTDLATTSTHEVYSINLNTGLVNRFASRSTIDAATGIPVGTALTNPDNLAIDADGHIYIAEDQPGGLADIWMARDDNQDGIAESLSRWASLSTLGAEPTGLYFDVTNPNIAFVNVQHPTSGVDSLVEISAVPLVGSLPLMLGAAGLMGVMRRRPRHEG